MTASRHRVWGKRGNRRVPLSEENTAGGPIDVRNGLYFRGCGSLFFYNNRKRQRAQARDQRVFLLHHPLVPLLVHIVIPNCIYPCSRHPRSFELSPRAACRFADIVHITHRNSVKYAVTRHSPTPEHTTHYPHKLSHAELGAQLVLALVRPDGNALRHLVEHLRMDGSR